MTKKVDTYCYRKDSFFGEAFPFAIRFVRNSAEKFNPGKRFHRQFWKIAYIVAGKGTYIIGDKRFPFTEKSIIVTHPDAETTWDIHGDELQLFNLVFDRSFFALDEKCTCDSFHFLKIFSEKYSTEYESPLFLLTADPETDRLIRSIYAEFEDCFHNREQMIRLRFQELILLILRRVEHRSRRNPDWTAQYLLAYLQRHFAEDISQKELAAKLEISPERLCRLFRERTGCSILQKIRELRIREAETLLKTTALPVHEIARKTGFNSLAYFCRIFNSSCNCSPEQYRRNIVQN